MILFERILFDRRELNKVMHHSINWKTPRRGYMIAISWAVEAGDWWKSQGEEVAKFFSIEWKYPSEGYVRTGVYIGRLAIVIQTLDRREDKP